MWQIFTNFTLQHIQQAPSYKLVSKYSKHTVKMLFIPFAWFCRSQVCVSRINSEDLWVSIGQNWTRNLAWLDTNPNDAGEWNRHVWLHDMTEVWHIIVICHFRLGAEDGYPVNKQTHFSQGALFTVKKLCLIYPIYTFDVKSPDLTNLGMPFTTMYNNKFRYCYCVKCERRIL